MRGPERIRPEIAETIALWWAERLNDQSFRERYRKTFFEALKGREIGARFVIQTGNDPTGLLAEVATLTRMPQWAFSGPLRMVVKENETIEVQESGSEWLEIYQVSP